jgi:ferrochelatase
VYQSKGARPGAWLGPYLDALLEGAALLEAPGAVVCPIGFMTDHMETLWDLDIVAKKRAAELGIPFVRAAVPNTDSALVDVLVDSVVALV